MTFAEQVVGTMLECSPYSSTRRCMQADKMLVNFHQATHCHVPERIYFRVRVHHKLLSFRIILIHQKLHCSFNCIYNSFKRLTRMRHCIWDKVLSFISNMGHIWHEVHYIRNSCYYNRWFLQMMTLFIWELYLKVSKCMFYTFFEVTFRVDMYCYILYLQVYRFEPNLVLVIVIENFPHLTKFCCMPNCVHFCH
jgi:hypothetical protein